MSDVGSPYSWFNRPMQDYPTGFTALFDAMISANRSQQLLTLLQDGHFLDSQTASEHDNNPAVFCDVDFMMCRCAVDNLTCAMRDGLEHCDAFHFAARCLLHDDRRLMHVMFVT